MPKYQASIHVCRRGMAKRCHTKTDDDDESEECVDDDEDLVKK